MKSALCLFGIIGGTRGKDGAGDPVDIEVCYKSYKDHIIDINNCDVFMHSWSTEVRNQLLELYKPKDFLIEPQIDFSSKVKNREKSKYLFNAYSRWYSTKKVVELKTQYEKENNFKYDWVMVGRFDILFFVDFLFKNLDPKYFHAAIWNAAPTYLPEKKIIKPPDQLNQSQTLKALLDFFFVANSDMMNKFSTVYDHLDEHERIADRLSQHADAWEHIKNVIGDPKKVIQYSLLRWFDFELYRRKLGGSMAVIDGKSDYWNDKGNVKCG